MPFQVEDARAEAKRKIVIANLEHDRKVLARAVAVARRQREADRLWSEGVEYVEGKYKIVS